MDNNVFSMPTDTSCRNPMTEDGKYLLPTSVSFHQPNSHYMNNQSQVMAEFPALFMTQSEFLTNLRWDPHLQNDTEVPICAAPKSSQHERVSDKDASIRRSRSTIGNIEYEGLYIAGMPNSAASHATLLVAKNVSDENLYDKGTLSPSVCAHEIQESFISSEYFDTEQASLGTYGNRGHEWRPDYIRSNRTLNDFTAPHLVGPVPNRTIFESLNIMGNTDQNCWISAENTSMSSDNTSGYSIHSSELSTGQSIFQSAVTCATTTPEDCSEISASGLCNHYLRDKQFDSEQTSCSINNLSLNFGSNAVQHSNLFSGYRFCRELQEILAELAKYTFGTSGHISYFTSWSGTRMDFPCSSSQPAERSYTVHNRDRFSDGDYLTATGHDAETRKELLNLLQMVDNEYNMRLGEIHTVIYAFHAVTELDPRIHSHFALHTVDVLYKNLKERISNSVLALGAHLHEGDRREEEKSFETWFIQKQWALQKLRRKGHQLWRPERGLPERSVSVLRAWMFQNFLHPYPKDAEKHLLAVKSGLTRSQVSNWFINARVRIWKPMIDEMYSEMNKRKAFQSAEKTSSQHRSLTSINSHRNNELTEGRSYISQW